MPSQKRLGDLLVEMKFIEEGQLRAALEEQRRSGRRLGKLLVDKGLITESRLVRALSRQLGIEICAPLTATIHPRVKELVPADIALRFHVMPLAVSREGTGQTLFVATADPLDMVALETIRQRVGSSIRVRWMLAGETEIELALARHYATDAPAPKKAPAHFPPKPKETGSEAIALQAGGGAQTPSGMPVIQGRRSSDVGAGQEPELDIVPLASALPPRDFRSKAEAAVARGNGLKSAPVEEPIPLDDEHLMPIPLDEEDLLPIELLRHDPTLPSPLVKAATPQPTRIPTAPSTVAGAIGGGYLDALDPRVPVAPLVAPSAPPSPAQPPIAPSISGLVVPPPGAPPPKSTPSQPSIAKHATPNPTIPQASWGDLLGAKEARVFDFDDGPDPKAEAVSAEFTPDVLESAERLERRLADDAGINEETAITTRPEPTDAAQEPEYDLPLDEATDLELSLGEPPELATAPAQAMIEEPDISIEAPLEPATLEKRQRPSESAIETPGSSQPDGTAATRPNEALRANVPSPKQDGHKDEAPWTRALEQAARQALDVDVLPPVEESESPSDEAAWLGAAAELAEAAAEDLPEATRAFVSSNSEPHLSIEPPVELKPSGDKPRPPRDKTPTLEMKRSDFIKPTTVADDASRVKLALYDVIRGRPVDQDTMRFLVRSIAAILVSEGLLDDGRLETAIERMRKDDFR
jgi:type II secretion system (T2SS) protein E